MLKRWAALPRGTRRLTGIAAAVLALAFLLALFVPLADWLARQDVGSARGRCTRRLWIMPGADC